MAIISVVDVSKLESSWRIDAEHYLPEFLDVKNKLTNVNTQRLSTIAYVGDGNHLKIAGNFLEEPGVRYLRGQDVSGDMLLDERNKIYLPIEFYNRLPRAQIFKEDVLITIVGANTGLVALVYDPPDQLLAKSPVAFIPLLRSLHRPHLSKPAG